MKAHYILLVLSALAGCLVTHAVLDPRAGVSPTHGRRRGGAYFQQRIAAVDQGLVTRALRSRGGAVVPSGAAATAAVSRLDNENRTNISPHLEAKKPQVNKGWGQLRRSAESQSSSSELVPRGGGQAASSGTGTVSKQAYKAALLKTCLLVICAGAFGLGTWVIKGKDSGLEFFAGYIVEQSLSVDNLFIFIMLFDYFKVPAEFQSRVLNWGIIGAMSMRAVMIVVGVAAIQRFRWVMLFFAGILVVSSANLLLEKEEDHDSAQLENNTVLKVANWMCDSTDYYDGEKFFTMVDGAKKATPLLLCLICIELTDFVFAVDSIPAVLGISHDTFIVYASNVFAICAMRSIYTLVSHAISDLPFLKPAVALVLGFVGGKMFAEFFHYDISVGISLMVVSAILSVGAAASVVSNRRRDAAAAADASAVSGGWAPGLTFEPPAEAEVMDATSAATTTATSGADALQESAAAGAAAAAASAATADASGAAVAVGATTYSALPNMESEGARGREGDMQGAVGSAFADPSTTGDDGDAVEAALEVAVDGSGSTAQGEGFSGGVEEGDGEGAGGSAEARAGEVDGDVAREDGEAAGDVDESAAPAEGNDAAAAGDDAAAAAAATRQKLNEFRGAEHEGENAGEGGEERQGGGG